MKTRYLIVALAFLVLAAFTANASSQCTGGVCKLPGKTVGAVKCPVDAKQIKDSAVAPKSTKSGMTFHFCSPACKAKFDKNPAAYASKCPSMGANKSGSFVCPVSGKKTACSSKTVCKSEYKGKTYCFANAAAKAKFDKNPKKYATTSASKVVSSVCPVMGNKIADVSKAVGKSVYKGKTYYFCCPSCKPAFDKDPEKYINKK
jgi:YHS domain-containing protein